MKSKLVDTSKKFYVACLAKLLAEEKGGKIGYDNYDNKGVFKGKIRELSKRHKLTQRKLINISNYCNFLWNLMETKKEDK